MKIHLSIVALLLGGCATFEITPTESRYSAQMHQALFPFGADEYTRPDSIDGVWTQVGGDTFPQKTPWNEPAEVSVSRDTVVFAVKPWASNSETLEDNEAELLRLFFKFDHRKYPRSIFSRSKSGFIVLTVDRTEIYMQGARKQGADFLGIGTFDPPVVLQRKVANKHIKPPYSYPSALYFSSAVPARLIEEPFQPIAKSSRSRRRHLVLN